MTIKGLFVKSFLQVFIPLLVVVGLTTIWLTNKDIFGSVLASSIVNFLLLIGLITAVSLLWSLTRMRKIIFLHELELRASTDQLTGVANRHHLIDVIQNELNRAMRYHTKFSLIMLDIDHFKDINDTFGHLIGDRILIELANISRETIRNVDTIGRFGGEEFVIVTPEIDRDAAMQIAERLRSKIAAAKLNLDDSVLQFTISLGVTSWLNSDRDLESILKRVDKALYQAKHFGRNRVISI